MAISVVSTAESSVNTAGTSHAVTLPASIAAGDLVLITMDIGSTSATLNALTDWTEILDESSANGLKILWYTGAGVPGNPTFTSSASTRSASIAWRITGADKTVTPTIGTTAAASSATPDPPITPAPPRNNDYLFIAFYGAAGEEADDDTWSDTPPTNYLPSPPLQKACGTAGSSLGGMIAAASRVLNTAVAENPGTFAKDVSAAYRAQTITVHPANFKDSPIGRVIPMPAPGTLTESRVCTDKPTGTVVLAGSRVESYNALLNDQFTDTDGTLLTAHTSDSGDTWTQHAIATSTGEILTNRLRATTSGTPGATYYSSDVPATPDYVVEARVRCVSNNFTIVGVYARFDTAASETAYKLLYLGVANFWYITKEVGGVPTQLGPTYTDALAAGNERVIQLQVEGAQITALIDGVVRIQAEDSAVTAAGRVGVVTAGQIGSGFHLDYVRALPITTHYTTHADNPVGQVVLSGSRIESYVLSGITHSEQVSGTVVLAGTRTESKVATESRSGTVVLAGTRTESSLRTESRSGVVVITGSRTESNSRTEARAGTVVLSGTRTESQAKVYTDSRSGVLLITGSRVEGKSAADTRSGTVVLAGSATRSTAYVETRSGVLLIAGTRTESYQAAGAIVYNDTATGTAVLAGTRTESWAASDSRSGTVVLVGTRVEGKVGTEARSGQLVLSGSRVESLVFTDQRSGTVVLSGSRVESRSATDARTGTVVLTGTRVETFIGPTVYTDSRAGTLVLAGARTESTSHTSSPTGTVVLSGTRIESYLVAGTYTDAATGRVVLSGTRTESHADRPAPIGTLVLQGTRTESKTHSQNVTGKVVTAGTRTESWGKNYTDSPTGRVVLSGTRTESHTLSYVDTPFGSLYLSGRVTESAKYVQALIGVLTVQGTLGELYLPSGATFDRPSGKIVLSGFVREFHNRWDWVDGERWPGDSDNRWNQGAGERWSGDDEDRWLLTVGNWPADDDNPPFYPQELERWK